MCLMKSKIIKINFWLVMLFPSGFIHYSGSTEFQEWKKLSFTYATNHVMLVLFFFVALPCLIFFVKYGQGDRRSFDCQFNLLNGEILSRRGCLLFLDLCNFVFVSIFV